MEIFKDIKGYEGLYQVSNFSRVKSIGRDKQIGKYSYKSSDFFIKTQINQGWYVKCVLYKEGNPKTYLCHRLSAIAFLDNPDNLPEVNHKDKNKTNNHIDNLEWVSKRENKTHGFINLKSNNKVGVYHVKEHNSWMVKVWVDKNIKQKYIGTYKTKEEANMVLDKYLLEIGVVNRYAK